MTLSEIKDQYAKEKGYSNWGDYLFKNNSIRFVEKQVDDFAKFYATACCKATQQKCAENAVCFWPNVKKESITNPSNIVLL